MVKVYRKRINAILLIILTVCFLCACGNENKTDVLSDEINRTATYIYDNLMEPDVGSVGGEWAVKAIKDSGIDVEEGFFEDYVERLENYVINKRGVLDDRRLTEYARVSIALDSLGLDATDFAGYNLITPMENYEKLTIQGVNAAAFALVASNLYDVKLECEDQLIDYIISSMKSGDYGYAGYDFGPDYQAMALEGLSFYTGIDKVDSYIDDTIKELQEMQKDDGSFGNCESTSEAICALSQLGIDVTTDKRFSKNGKTPLDGLLEYKMKDGGFTHTLEEPETNAMASEKALMALNSIKLCKQGKKLYGNAG